jgi:uncharacterized protein (DUF4415 family)
VRTIERRRAGEATSLGVGGIVEPEADMECVDWQQVYIWIETRLDPDVLAYFRALGPGWQTRINATLRRAAKLGKKPLTDEKG